MIIFPAIDLYAGRAVRLYKGNYNEMTVYNSYPREIAADFKRRGAEAIHIVDLEGAREGTTPNFETVLRVKDRSGLFCEVGGGIRSIEVVDQYLNAGIDRIILGTAAIRDEALLQRAIDKHGPRIAVGADLRDGYIAVNGWREKSNVTAEDFFKKMQKLGVENIVCTDISRDGALRGANLRLYHDLSKKYRVKITASGGVSFLSDIVKLRDMGLYGAIIGKAYYEGTLDLAEAIEVAK